MLAMGGADTVLLQAQSLGMSCKEAQVRTPSSSATRPLLCKRAQTALVMLMEHVTSPKSWRPSSVGAHERL